MDPCLTVVFSRTASFALLRNEHNTVLSSAHALLPLVLRFRDAVPSARVNALHDRVDRVTHANILCPSIFVNDPCPPHRRHTEELSEMLVLVFPLQHFDEQTMRRTTAR